eukprot:TRINITY_DN6041_c0_g1_i3.p1 TRINITY_DN6041_c0_g1~~TRINITY_DN6041_c0_g1_i3.p1  ORF type:complete len:118 (+),score=6.80 TRINITY_DN6041_c0_g1_i3:130-483(+)
MQRGLVGSEMCIRDRLQASHETAQRACLLALLEFRQPLPLALFRLDMAASWYDHIRQYLQTFQLFLPLIPGAYFRVFLLNFVRVVVSLDSLNIFKKTIILLPDSLFLEYYSMSLNVR